MGIEWRIYISRLLVVPSPLPALLPLVNDFHERAFYLGKEIVLENEMITTIVLKSLQKKA